MVEQLPFKETVVGSNPTGRTKDFDVSAKVAEFKELKGEIYACGSCLKVRGKEESKVCPVSTMSDLLKMVEGSDKVLVFG